MDAKKEKAASAKKPSFDIKHPDYEVGLDQMRIFGCLILKPDLLDWIPDAILNRPGVLQPLLVCMAAHGERECAMFVEVFLKIDGQLFVADALGLVGPDVNLAFCESLSRVIQFGLEAFDDSN